MEKKAKDVKKIFSNAIKQLPNDTPSIVHIGYETLHGPEVEMIRQNKIYETMCTFDCGEKPVVAVFCNSFQAVSLVEGFDCAETTMHFGRLGCKPEKILPIRLLLTHDDKKGDDTTHWEQDYLNPLGS